MRLLSACLPLLLVTGGCPGAATDRGRHHDAATSTGQPLAPAGRSGGRFFSRGAAGDERELLLRRFSVQVTARAATVRSHLTIEVATADQDTREAVVRLAIPRGAAVTSAVLWVGGRPMRGAFVERARASEVYRSIVARRRDPALVTWEGPGFVGISIFPLTRQEPRRFELEWVEVAAVAGGELQYRVPTLGERGRLVARASLEVDGRALPAAATDVVSIGPGADTPVVAARIPGDAFHAVLVREPASAAAPHFVLVAETSAAMTSTDRLRQRTAIEAVLRALPPASRVTLLAADWETSPLAEDAAPAALPAALARMDDRISAGALHLERALLEAAGRARTTGAGAVLFVGRAEDAFPGDALRAPLARLREARLRLSVIGFAQVPRWLADAVALTGGEAARDDALEEQLPALLDALRPRPEPPALGLRGARDWHALETVTGQMAWIGRALAAPPPSAAQAAAGATPALMTDLLALWDRARLAVWNPHALTSAASATALTPLRALLVLEREQDYAAFGLAAPGPDAPPPASNAPAPEERMAPLGLRGPPENPSPERARALAEEVARNAGTLGALADTGSALASVGADAELAGGTMGLGEYATVGRGAMLGGGRRAVVPEVIPGRPVVRGSIDGEIIRRIVGRHLGEVKFCYESELTRSPDLEGRASVQFSFGPTGRVLGAVIQESTLASPRLEGCLVQAVRRWDFPKTLGGGTVVASYPFVLTPRGRRAPQEPAPSKPPRDPASEALAVLRREGPIDDRVRRICALLGMAAMTDPEALAWSIDRREGSFRQVVLVGHLLHVAGRGREAVRVLSERAPASPEPVAAELHLLGADADAAEVRALAARR
jgi:hypothetical protein